jgi:hypothetical protein
MSTNSAWPLVNSLHFTIVCTRIYAAQLELIVNGIHVRGPVQGRHRAGDVWAFYGMVVAISDLRLVGLVLLSE